MHDQGQFDFGIAASEAGYNQWLANRRVAGKELARRLGLPLGRPVEVWLRLRGKLRLQEELLFIQEDHLRHLALAVDHVNFAYREMESCVRLD